MKLGKDDSASKDSSEESAAQDSQDSQDSQDESIEGGQDGSDQGDANAFADDGEASPVSYTHLFMILPRFRRMSTSLLMVFLDTLNFSHHVSREAFLCSSTYSSIMSSRCDFIEVYLLSIG